MINRGLIERNIEENVLNKILFQIRHHPRLLKEKKHFLLYHTVAHFIQIRENMTLDQIRKDLGCNRELAVKYKQQYLKIDWQSDARDNLVEVKNLVDIVSDIMDWQKNAPAHLTKNMGNQRFWSQPTELQLRYVQEINASEGQRFRFMPASELRSQQAANPAPSSSLLLNLAPIVLLLLMLTTMFVENRISPRP